WQTFRRELDQSNCSNEPTMARVERSTDKQLINSRKLNNAQATAVGALAICAHIWLIVWTAF
ncbi:hypothetical protein M514_22519, partial [Trichuris suis]